jgi:hypothetical protein
MRLAATVAVLLATVVATRAAGSPLAHSHNDYEQPRPLQDALEQGFDSVEADIWLVEGKLLVAHQRTQVQAARTLQSLYLDPLRQRVNRGATVPQILLIDVKTAADDTWRALDETLARYPDLAGRVRFIVSGNRARELMAAQATPRAAIDGRIDDLDGSASAELIPLVSDNWAKYFTWRGEGEFPAAERAKLRDFVARAHAQQRLLRFWNTPDLPAVWRVLRECGVDVIGTDHLAELRHFLDQP